VSHLLDTNFVIGLLRGPGAYWEYLDRLLTDRLPAVSVVTRSEVFAGCHPHEEPATQRLLDRFESIPVNAAIAELAGK
jgi:predicted nucleic acid-binding protein